ncbi:MAG: hypothetical protein HQRvContig04_33 [Haloquadratum phage sp.]|nr:MAG: hypothetical protein HQRvContig04_33 [Haloquadratum phage sp.]
MSDDDSGPDLSERVETAQDRLTDAADIAREYAARAADALAAHRTGLRLAGALAAVAAVLAGFVATAWLGWGALAGVLFVGGLVAGAAAPPVAILMFREAVPNIAGTGLAIAAQVAFGKAGLVRREDGQYEWGVLREDTDGYYVALADGGRINVDADPGELFSFGFGDLAVSEAHGSNLDRFRETHTPGDSDQPTERRAGIPVEPPRKERENTILVSLAKIQRVVRGSASSELVRRGRDKALDEAGGTGQLSTLWTMAFAAALLVVGFGMTAGVLVLA